jgi:hypothetical protein
MLWTAAGVSAKSAVEVEVGPRKPWEQIMDGLAVIESGSRAEFRRSRRITDEFDSTRQSALLDRPRELSAANSEPTGNEILIDETWDNAQGCVLQPSDSTVGRRLDHRRRIARRPIDSADPYVDGQNTDR